MQYVTLRINPCSGSLIRLPFNVLLKRANSGVIQGMFSGKVRYLAHCLHVCILFIMTMNDGCDKFRKDETCKNRTEVSVGDARCFTNSLKQLLIILLKEKYCRRSYSHQ